MTSPRNIIITTEDMHEIARLRGGYFLSPEYINSRTKYLWKCGDPECNHEWWATGANVKNNGTWCDKCARREKAENMRKSIEELHMLASKHNGTFLETSYTTNMNDIFTWKCEKGHQFENSAANVSAGQWCKECFIERRSIKRRSKNLIKLEEMVEKLGASWNSNDYKNIKSTCEFTCQKGHRFPKRVEEVLNGKWCKECEKDL